MALAFPLTAAQFFDGLKIGSMRCWFTEPQSLTRLGDGTVIPSSLGATLWRGEIQLVLGTNADQAAVDAMLGLASMAGASFLAHDTRLNGPRMDPGGVALGSSIVQVQSQQPNGREITLEGLPAGYTLSRGDLIGWSYGSPVRRAMHRIVTGGTAATTLVGGAYSSGYSDGYDIGTEVGGSLTIEVTPHIRGGLTNGTTVELVRPTFKAILDNPVEYSMGGRLLTGGASFSFIQTLSV